MKGLELLLQALTAANQATPAIVGLINLIKGGQDSGKSDDEILAEATAYANETRAITEEDMKPGA
jgi:hypothetical protein